MRKTSGVSLMLLIFLSLCLIIFSLLSLSGAVADETLSSQAAERTTEYYAAVTAANGVLAQIDSQLAAYLREAEDSESSQTAEKKTGSVAPEEQTDKQMESDYLQLCRRIGEDVPDASWEDSEENGEKGGVISFSVDVDDEQILQVRLNVSYPDAEDDKLYRIQSRKVVNTGEWNADQSMNLFRSEDIG